jgi:hypothetical protein
LMLETISKPRKHGRNGICLTLQASRLPAINLIDAELETNSSEFNLNPTHLIAREQGRFEMMRILN